MPPSAPPRCDEPPNQRELLLPLEGNASAWRGSTMDTFSYPFGGGQDPQEYEDKFGLTLQVYRIFRG